MTGEQEIRFILGCSMSEHGTLSPYKIEFMLYRADERRHCHSNSGLRFDVMNKLNARGGLFVGQKAAAAAGAHM